MDEATSDKINWLYEMANYISDEFEPNSWNDYEIEEAWHHFGVDPNTGEIEKILLSVIVRATDHYESAPHDLLNFVLSQGLTLEMVQVDWDEKTIQCRFKHTT